MDTKPNEVSLSGERYRDTHTQGEEGLETTEAETGAIQP